MRVLMIAEQLRRAVPGGIGTYVRGLSQGLHAIRGVEASADVAPYDIDVTLFASRPPGGRQVDPLRELGFQVRCSSLPGPALTRSWDSSRCRARRTAGLTNRGRPRPGASPRRRGSA